MRFKNLQVKIFGRLPDTHIKVLRLTALMEQEAPPSVERISCGSAVIDHLLGGGLEKGVVTTVYGPAGSGKSTLCLLALIEVARSGKKVLFIDTEGGFSVERMRQLAGDTDELLTRVIFLRPTNFEEQKKVFEKIRAIKDKDIGLIVVDTIAMLYRLELGSGGSVYETNRELGRQISYLTEMTRKYNIPVLITNQVYSTFDDREKIKMVGGDILKYWSKCLLEIQIMPESQRKAVLRKHRSISELKEAVFEIKQVGFLSVKTGRGFNLF